MGPSEPAADLVGKDVVQHQHVGLLHDLRVLHPLPPEQEVGGDRPAGRDVGDAQRFEIEEAGELLVEAGLRVEAVDQRVGERPPGRPLLLVDRAGGFGPRGRGAQVPAREHVRERVVVDRLVVLVGADHAVEMGVPVVIEASP